MLTGELRFVVVLLEDLTITISDKSLKPVTVYMYTRTELLSYSQAPDRMNSTVWHRLKELDLLPPSTPLPSGAGEQGHTSRGRLNHLLPTIKPDRSLHATAGQAHPETLTHVVTGSPHFNKWQLPTFMNTNITGALAAKLNEISVLCKDNHVDIACITETWCMEHVPDAAVSLNGYISVCRDRQDGRQHGGIPCYIRECIPFHVWEQLDECELETLWLTTRPQCMPREFPCLTVGIVYHPPKPRTNQCLIT